MKTFSAGTSAARRDTRPAARVQRDRPRPGRRLRDQQRHERRVLERARPAAESSSGPFFFNLSTAGVRSPKEFFAMTAGMELTFNWHYPDPKHIDVFSPGGCPCARRSTGPADEGNGQYEWRGWLRSAFAPPCRGPYRAALIVNWNNKPAAAFRGRRQQLVVRLRAARRDAEQGRRGEARARAHSGKRLSAR